jgi:hypothetical protein
MRKELTNINVDICARVDDILDSMTEGFHEVIFKLLKETYVPMYLAKIVKNNGNPEQIQVISEEFQDMIIKCWNVIKGETGTFNAQTV